MRLVLLVPTMLFALALGGGCITQSTVTEQDRQVNWQTLGAAEEVVTQIRNLRPLVSGVAGAGLMLDAAEAALEDIILNARLHVEIHGPPKKQERYSKPEAASARKAAKESHAAGGFWKTVAGIFLSGIGLVLGFQRYGGPIVQAIPWLGEKAAPLMAKVQKWMAGSTGKALDEATATVATARKEGSLPIDTIKNIADRVQSDGFANTVLMESAHYVEEKVLGGKL